MKVRMLKTVLLITLSSDDNQCVYIYIHNMQWWWSMCLYLFSMINVSISHIHIHQWWWWSICLHLISISSNGDDQCVYISYPYQALMMINVSISHIHIKQWWSFCVHIKQWSLSMCLYRIYLSSHDDDQSIYISYSFYSI